ncbi:MAG TPA: hypothetical protein VGQ75_01005 [Thermoanaerobaculia bacterium]|nr:hypothetical protein [Thermoanaerobaculia bacterium]
MRRRVGAAGCFRRGFTLSLSKPYLAASLWLIQLLLASVIVLPVSNALHSLLDVSSSGSRMVADPDFGWWETVRRMHPDLLGTLPNAVESVAGVEGVKSTALSDLQGIGATAISLAMLGIVLHAFALGGVFGALREPQASLVVFGREGMRRFPAFLAFTLAGLAAALAAYRWIYLETGEAWRDRMNDLDTEAQAMALTAARVLALLLVLAAIKLLVDSVRAIWVARPDLPAVSRLVAGVAAAFSRPARLFGVLLFYVFFGAALYALWIVLDPSAGGEARFALVPLILTQQVFVFLRSLLKVGYYAGVSEALTRVPSPEYSYVPAPVVDLPLSVDRAADEAPIERPPGAI